MMLTVALYEFTFKKMLDSFPAYNSLELTTE
jgi:hypothetical protein